MQKLFWHLSLCMPVFDPGWIINKYKHVGDNITYG